MHAQCWAPTRRGFFEAQTVEPEAAAQAMNFIGQLYEIEEQIRQKKLAGVQKRDERQTQAKPIVERFFAWVDERFEAQGCNRSLLLKKSCQANDLYDRIGVLRMTRQSRQDAPEPT